MRSGAREARLIDSSGGFQLKVLSKLLSGCAPTTLKTGFSIISPHHLAYGRNESVAPAAARQSENDRVSHKVAQAR